MSKPTPIRAAILVRVSTKSQETARQRHELEEEAKRRGWTVVEVIEEKISGTAAEEDREGLIRLRELVAAGSIQKVMIHEITRLGRRSSVVHGFIEYLSENKVSLYWHAQAAETLLANGKSNPSTAIMLAVLSEMGKAETDLLKERILSGLSEARRKGVVLGRKPGAVPVERFLEKNRAAVDVVKKHPALSIRDQAKLADVSAGLVLKIRKALSAA